MKRQGTFDYLVIAVDGVARMKWPKAVEPEVTDGDGAPKSYIIYFLSVLTPCVVSGLPALFFVLQLLQYTCRCVCLPLHHLVASYTQWRIW